MADDKERSSSVACLVCGQDADRLCDYILGRDVDKASRESLITGRIEALGEPYFTCDAPLCSECVSIVGWMHGGEGGEAWCDTMDVCPVHEGEGLGTLHPLVREHDVAVYRRRLSMAVINGVPSGVDPVMKAVAP